MKKLLLTLIFTASTVTSNSVLGTPKVDKTSESDQIYQAILNNDTVTLQTLINNENINKPLELKRGRDVANLRNINLYLPLEVAIKKGKIACVKMLLRLGANHKLISAAGNFASCHKISVEDHIFKGSLLSLCAELRLSPEFFKLLLNKDSLEEEDQRAFQKDQCTMALLKVASSLIYGFKEEERCEIVKMLIEHGADVNAWVQETDN